LLVGAEGFEPPTLSV